MGATKRLLDKVLAKYLFDEERYEEELDKIVHKKRRNQWYEGYLEGYRKALYDYISIEDEEDELNDYEL